MSGVRTTKGKTIFEVDGGVDVSLSAANEAHDSVDLESSFFLGTTYSLHDTTSSLVHSSGATLHRHLSVLWQQSSLLEVREYASCF